MIEALIKRVAEGEKLSTNELADLVDAYVTKRDARLLADKTAAALKTDETILHDALMQQFQLQGVKSLGSARFGVKMAGPEYQPSVKDWPALYAYIKENDAFELLERRPGKGACRERWDAGEIIPGVEKFPVYKLSVSKVK